MKCAVLSQEGEFIDTQSIKTPKTLEKMYEEIKLCFGCYAV